MSALQAAAHDEQWAMLRELAEQHLEVLERLVGAAVVPNAPPLLVALHHMGDGDDLQVFLKAFRTTALVCHWPEEEWAPRLLLLLSGEAQMGSLPPACHGVFDNVSRAVLD